MADNRGVAYLGTGKVEIQNIDYPTWEIKEGPGVHPRTSAEACHTARS